MTKKKKHTFMYPIPEAPTTIEKIHEAPVEKKEEETAFEQKQEQEEAPVEKKQEQVIVKAPTDVPSSSTIDTTLANMRIIGDIPVNGRLSITNGQLRVDTPRTWYGKSLQRWMRGDSRNATLKYINETLTDVSEISEKLMRNARGMSIIVGLKYVQKREADLYNIYDDNTTQNEPICISVDHRNILRDVFDKIGPNEKLLYECMLNEETGTWNPIERSFKTQVLLPWTLGRFLQELEHFQTGLVNLKSTYASDKSTIAILETFIDRQLVIQEELRAFISENP